MQMKTIFVSRGMRPSWYDTPFGIAGMILAVLTGIGALWGLWWLLR